MKILIANSNKVLNHLYSNFNKDFEVSLISDKAELSETFLVDFKPDWIFFPHWSYIIPEKIYKSYRCVVFHMTDLPFGRGGSPLQNLIVRNIHNTKISAIKVTKELDGGDIYLKSDLNLYGRAEEIYQRAAKIILSMIHEIVFTEPEPTPQHGKAVSFPRRKPEESEIKEIADIERLYDFIRMLDAPGYPKAFLDFGSFLIEFERPTLHSDNSIKADVVIKLKH